MFIARQGRLWRMILASAFRLSIEEVQNCLVGNLRLVRKEKMTRVRNEHKLCARNATT